MTTNLITPVITIDGTSGSGKGAVSISLANRLSWNYLDSGALYRVLAYYAELEAIPLTNIAILSDLASNLMVSFEREQVLLHGKEIGVEIRTESVAYMASQIAVIPEVRESLLNCQRAYCKLPGLIAEGRDMGTVVFPEAQLKIFLNADLQERAKRRHAQLLQLGIDVNLSQVISEIHLRDDQDIHREVAPLQPAQDALIIDSTNLNVEQIVESIIKEYCKNFALS